MAPGLAPEPFVDQSNRQEKHFQLPPLSYKGKRFFTIALVNHLLAACCFIRYKGRWPGRERFGGSRDPSTWFLNKRVCCEARLQTRQPRGKRRCNLSARSLCNTWSPFILDLAHRKKTAVGHSWRSCFHEELKLNIISYAFTVEVHHKANRQIWFLP